MGTAQYLRDERLQRLVPLHIFTTSRYNDLGTIGTFLNSLFTASVAWSAANRALYVPLTIPHRFTVARFFSSNGSSVAGTMDIGLYSNAGAKLISTGPASQAGTSQIQYIDVTDQSFPPGRYYLALLASSTSTRLSITNYQNAQECRIAGALEEDVGASTLPSTMTPAAFANNLYHFGFTQSDTL